MKHYVYGFVALFLLSVDSVYAEIPSLNDALEILETLEYSIKQQLFSEHAAEAYILFQELTQYLETAPVCTQEVRALVQEKIARLEQLLSEKTKAPRLDAPPMAEQINLNPDYADTRDMYLRNLIITGSLILSGQQLSAGSSTGTVELSGDVIGASNATVVNTLCGASACAVVGAYENATSADAPNTLVLRDNNGSFSATTITVTAALRLHDGSTGNAVTLEAGAGTASYTLQLPTSYGGVNQVLSSAGTNPDQLTWQPITAIVTSTINLSGDVIGSSTANKVNTICGVAACNIVNTYSTVFSATSADVPLTLVLRDNTGSFAATTLTLTGCLVVTDTNNNLAGTVCGSTSALIIAPHGNRALQASSLGNARGIHAVDLQIGGGGVSTQVASGKNSVIAGGAGNTASGIGSVVVGGGYDGSTYSGNIADGNASFIGAGIGNSASNYALVGGGCYNIASGNGSIVVGGGYDGSTYSGNIADGNASFIGGGLNNQNTSGDYVVIAGGWHNIASGNGSIVVGGGYDGSTYSANIAAGNASFVGGGLDNQNNSGDYAVIAGGCYNTASGTGSVVVGGGTDGSNYYGNTASGNASFIGAGIGNSASNTSALVGGGYYNTASGIASVVVCGGTDGTNYYGNIAAGNASFVGGGFNNQNTSGDYVVIAGGGGNSASSNGAVVVGGYYNGASGNGAVIVGGGTDGSNYYGNNAAGNASFIGGGLDNHNNSGDYAVIAGGYGNYASSNGAIVVGGYVNIASGHGSVIVGGGYDGFTYHGNNAAGNASFIGGGLNNQNTNANYAVIVGGASNSVTGYYASILGGYYNQANGYYAVALGNNAIAQGNGSFVFADSTSSGYYSNGDNTFNVLATGGVFMNNIYSVPLSGSTLPVVVNSSGQLGVGTGSISTATSADTPNTLVLRDNTGSFLASTITVTTALNILDNDANLAGIISAQTTGLIIAPQGGYALQASSLGNPRGQGAVDLQIGVGSGSSQVASGYYAVIAGGYGNSASGNGAVVVGGGTDGISFAGNTASGISSFVGGGVNNSASNESSLVVGGYYNTASGEQSVVVGGLNNTASGGQSVVVGGGASIVNNYYANIAGGAFSFIGGGGTNRASSLVSFIGGGVANSALNQGALVVGGYYNIASGNASVVVGGGYDGSQYYGNTAAGNASFVGGGYNNQNASGDYAVIVGGRINTASNTCSTVAGGSNNTASGSYAVVAGGHSNQSYGIGSVVAGGGYDGLSTGGNVAQGPASFIGGGLFNNIAPAGNYSLITGGVSNSATAYYASILGGYYNQANGYYSVAMGNNAYANDNGSFVFADSTSNGYTSNGNNTFNVLASGGVFMNNIYSVPLSGSTLPVVVNSSGQLGVGTGSISTATSADTPNTLVLRDNTGSFLASTITVTTALNILDNDANLAGIISAQTTGLIIAPQGGYALQASSLGNPRGQGAVDLQIGVGSGSSQVASGYYAVIAGGYGNTASGNGAVIVGGGTNGTNFLGNTAGGNGSFIGGGLANTASGLCSVVVGGGYDASGQSYTGNTASGISSFVGGGVGNNALNNYASVLGGYYNLANGYYSVAMGNNAIANDNGSFVFADSTPNNYLSNGPDTFNVRATGGVFMTGIYGVSVGLTNPVYVSSSGQLGDTASSSRRYKENVENIGDLSEDIYKLRPVVFNYIGDATKSFNVGLIAEEVEEIYPQLTVYKDNQIEGVRYHHLPMMMLNEQQKDHARLLKYEQRMARLECQYTHDLCAMQQKLAELQAKIDQLTA